MANKKLTFASISEQLLHWFSQHGRHDLPWQHPRTPYRVWLAEIMLQQTQVATVIPYYEKFLQRFPSVESLAEAHSDEVMRYWAGLGYYARARNLHRAAQKICTDFCGEWPRDMAQLQTLPGIGRSTAAAILAQAFGDRHAILDGNVKRVLCRYHGVEGWSGDKKVQDVLWRYAEQHTPPQQLVDYTQAIMDFGATLCTRSKPRCQVCPLQSDCVAWQQNRVAQLPQGKPRKTLPVKTVQMLVLRDGQHVLLEKRPPAGIWGGLWSLPEFSIDADVISACQTQWHISLHPLQHGTPFRHTFSHYHLDITPVFAALKNHGACVMEAGRWLWYNVAQPDLPALPAPVAQIIQQLQEDLP